MLLLEALTAAGAGLASGAAAPAVGMPSPFFTKVIRLLLLQEQSRRPLSR